MRVGFSTQEQTASSKFKFEGGKGEIIDCKVVVDKFGEGSEATYNCAFAVTIQGMNKEWQPLDDEPVTENLNCGPASKFHPANASSSDDPEPTDLGEEEGAEGNCFISLTGKGPDKKSKVSIFGRSLEEFGFKPAYLNGYAPNLIGLRAEFFQQPQPKGSNYTGKNDPTALVVKSIAVMPANQGGKTTGATAAKTAPAKPTSTQAAKPNGKANGAPAPAVDNGGDDEVSNIAIQMLAAVGQSSGGQTLTRQKIGSKLVTLLAKNQIKSTLHKAVQEKVKDNEWFAEQADNLGWTVAETGEATIPAAA